MSNQHVFALVTGASRGIGKSIVEKLLESDARVIGTTRKSPFSDQFQSSERFTGIQVDLNNPDSVEKQIHPLFQSAECPNVLINNAAIFDDMPFTADDSDWQNHWEQTLRVNLTMPVLISKWALNRWTEQKNGILINISSRAAYRGDTEPYSAYAASKGALVAFTKTVARGFGKDKIAAYSIAPGFINTDMAKESIPIYGEEYIIKDIVLEEITPPEEVGELVSWLASGKVKHLTGSTFHINGGSYMI